MNVKARSLSAIPPMGGDERLTRLVEYVNLGGDDGDPGTTMQARLAKNRFIEHAQHRLREPIALAVDVGCHHRDRRYQGVVTDPVVRVVEDGIHSAVLTIKMYESVLRRICWRSKRAHKFLGLSSPWFLYAPTAKSVPLRRFPKATERLQELDVLAIRR
ncbi:hypothetical protein [Sinomonas sp. G460-2]|uniref:hypothetical protein n=1 Tax=Sinomonas sp. G460-2 TaxID=3393464 RepID=UPI0039EF0C21